MYGMTFSNVVVSNCWLLPPLVNFVCKLPMAVARLSSGVAIRLGLSHITSGFVDVVMLAYNDQE